MIKQFLLLSLLLLAVCCVNSQQPVVKSIEKKGTGLQYKDFIVLHDTIWALAADGSIRLLTTNGDLIRTKIVSRAAIAQLAMDRSGDIWIGDQQHSIRKYDPIAGSWTTITTDTNTLFGITFDSKNNGYLLTDKGIVDIASHTMYFPDSSLNVIRGLHKRWIKEPVYLMDSQDKLWIGFGYGEWGGDLVIFDCNNKRFVQPVAKHIASLPVKSIFEGAGSIFITESLMHFSTRGKLLRVDRFACKTLLYSDTDYGNDSVGSKNVAGEYIGPGAYNPTDHCIYFYSQNGLFKGNPNVDLSNIEYWTKVATPRLRWSNGQPDAVGSPMNVLKMTITRSGKLLFLSQVDGIGIFDGKSLIMVK